MFSAGFLGWTWDSFDFFTVSMTITELSEEFGVSYSDVSWVSVHKSYLFLYFRGRYFDGN